MYYSNNLVLFTQKEAKAFSSVLIDAMDFTVSSDFMRKLTIVFHRFLIEAKPITTSDLKTVRFICDKIGIAFPQFPFRAGLYYRPLFDSRFSGTRGEAIRIWKAKVVSYGLNEVESKWPDPDAIIDKIRMCDAPELILKGIQSRLTSDNDPDAA